MNLPQAKGRPSQIYRGDFVFYFIKLGLGVFGIFSVSVGIGGFTFGIVVTLQAGNYTIETLGMVLILFAILGNGIFLGITFLHMYPEVGISETHFWFRHFGIGHTIPWVEINDVRMAKTLFVTQGLVVYSNKLPFYYWFFGRAYGRKAGKALLIPNQLQGIDELKVQLQTYGRFSSKA